jgi:hypothetical protein
MSQPNKKSRFAKQESPPCVQHSVLETAEEDYMAPLEDFLPTDSSAVKYNVPKVSAEPHQQSKKVKIQTLMEENRQKGCAVPIGSGNVGFKLLAKFGYKDGEGLGKDNQGASKPIAVVNRITAGAQFSGLGVLETKIRKTEDYVERQNQMKRLREETQELFLQTRFASKYANKLRSDTFKAQKVIYELDNAAGVLPHRLTMSVHAVLGSESGGDEVSGFPVNAEQVQEESSLELEDCLLYLRERYSYCYYCGVKFTDTPDMLASCPGPYEDDH